MPPATTSLAATANIGAFLAEVSDADLRLLRLFDAVVTAGGLSAATDVLQADLSTISRHIKDLEQRIGARLCQRGRAGFALTAHGKQVHLAAQELFLAIKTFQENINSLHADPVGQLRVGVMDALISDPQCGLSAALRRFIDLAPRVCIHLSQAKPDEIERAVLSGELDLGVVVTRARLAGLRYQQLYLERSSLYCAAPHPCFGQANADMTVADAAGMPLVQDPYTDKLPLRGPAARFRQGAQADTIEAAALLIRTGHFVGFLPEHYARAVAPDGSLWMIRPDLFSYQQGIDVVVRATHAGPLVRSLLAQFDAIPA